MTIMMGVFAGIALLVAGENRCSPRYSEALSGSGQSGLRYLSPRFDFDLSTAIFDSFFHRFFSIRCAS
jgi:hypothetical protein